LVSFHISEALTSHLSSLVDDARLHDALVFATLAAAQSLTYPLQTAARQFSVLGAEKFQSNLADKGWSACFAGWQLGLKRNVAGAVVSALITHGALVFTRNNSSLSVPVLLGCSLLLA